MNKTLLMGLLLTVFLTIDIQAVEAKSLNNEPSTNGIASLNQKQWIHGSQDCKANKDPAIEVFQYDESSYILRQNKCLSYEAPFIYVFIGDEKTLVVDTGATASSKSFPLYETIQSLTKKHLVDGEVDKRQILVVHSHSHSDHYGADSQFIGQANVTVVAPNSDGINEYFAFENWPEQQTKLDLGGRSITIIPTPGHQEEAISIYDSQTQWLLTGDTFYPGYVYVKNWNDYKNSIARLLSFTKNHDVSAILGAHIEMKSKAGEYYEIGTIYQPDESPLPLMPIDLATLNTKLQQATKPAKISLNRLIVEPLGALPKLISSIVSWFM
ncbi:MAG: MBL fold metallo-hydrolase [Colwellia sp.]|nr:MBL fold metallo-hydrolase [Colwellia sp.]